MTVAEGRAINSIIERLALQLKSPYEERAYLAGVSDAREIVVRERSLEVQPND